MMCEKCWDEAAARAYGTCRDQYEVYREILEERKDSPCSPKEQAGDWWDEQNQCDKRLIKEEL